MPELPEVETIVRGLSESLIGKSIRSVHVVTPSILKSPTALFISSLQNKTITKIHRHGKFMFIRFAHTPLTLQIHLGMTGQLLFEPVSMEPLKHTHVIFKMEGMTNELRYRDIRRFGYLQLLESREETKLGPDAWESPPEVLLKALQTKSGMLKNALLNQHVIAGLGNIYVDESLYLARLHPKKTLESLQPKKLQELCAAIRTVLQESIVFGGTSFRNYVDTKGGRGGFKGRLKVYGKEGQACCSCGGKIRKILAAGRGTHFCPKCQRAPKKR